MTEGRCCANWSEIPQHCPIHSRPAWLAKLAVPPHPSRQVHNNMRIAEDSKVCPRCGGDCWQHDQGMVECMACFWWGWNSRRL